MKLVLQIAAGVVLAWLVVTGLKLTAAAFAVGAVVEAFKDDTAASARANKAALEASKRTAAIANQKRAEDARLQAERQLVQAERQQAEIASQKEARRPKAYRWKDSRGTAHITDAPPTSQQAATFEIIYLQ